MGDLDKVEKILIVVLVCVHASRLRHDDGQDRRRDMGLSDRPWHDHRLRHGGGIPVNDVDTLDTSIWAGYIVRPKGDMRLYTCRVYETLQEASDVAQERADSHHKPYEVRVTCDTSQRIVKTIEPRKSK